MASSKSPAKKQVTLNLISLTWQLESSFFSVPQFSLWSEFIPWVYEFFESLAGSAFLGWSHFLALSIDLRDLALQSALFQPCFCTARYRTWVFANIVWFFAILSNTIWDQPVVPNAWNFFFFFSLISCSASVVTQLEYRFTKASLASLCAPRTPCQAGLGALSLYPPHGLCLFQIQTLTYINHLFIHFSLLCHTLCSVCLLMWGTRKWFFYMFLGWMNKLSGVCFCVLILITHPLPRSFYIDPQASSSYHSPLLAIIWT